MKKITKKEMMMFASGDLFGGGAQLVIAFFYLRFLTDVVRIDPVLAGTVILVSKIWDAILDPVMGVVTDNTRTRFGRRKPYLLAGFFLILVAFTLLWYAPNFESSIGKFLFVSFSYIFFSTVSTIVTIPYTAFSSEISQNVNERDQVNGTRLFFSQVSSLIGAVLPMVIVGLLPEKTGYLFMGFVFSIFYAIPYLGIFLLCEERVPVNDERRRFSFTEIISPFRVKTYRSLIGMYLSAFFVMDVVSAVFSYYMTYLIHREDLLEFVLGTMLITQIIMLFFVVKLAGKIGKPKTYMIGAAIFIIGTIALGFYNNSWPIATIFIISAVIGLGLTACIVIPWVMFPDVTDVSLLAFGERRSGSFAGFMAFLRKFSSAIGIWTIGLMLQLSGYMQPGEMIIPKNASAFVDKEAKLNVDLQNDGNDDIRIDMNQQKVDLLSNEKMSYVFDNDLLKIRLNNEQKDSIIVEKGIKVTDVYDFNQNSSLKSVNYYNQPDSFITGLRVIIFVLPAILLLFAILIASKYPLSRKIYERLLKFYEQKNKNKEEEDELKKLLF